MTLLNRACISPNKLYLYVVPFLIYSALKNGVTLKLGVGSRTLKMAPFDRS